MGLLASLGLRGNGWGGPLWVLLASLTCWLGLALLGTPNTALTALDATMLAVMFPLAEEVLFRGLGFVLLVKIVRAPGHGSRCRRRCCSAWCTGSDSAGLMVAAPHCSSVR